MNKMDNKKIQEKVDDFCQSIDYVENVLIDNHYLDVEIKFPDNILNFIISGLEDYSVRNCLIMDILDRNRASYKLLKDFINTSPNISDTAMSNALCLYIISMIRVDSMFTFYDDIAQLSHQKYPDNHFLKILANYSRNGDIDEMLPNIYAGSQQIRKELGIK